MMRQVLMGCAIVWLWCIPAKAVSLRVATSAGDSVFYGAVGDTVSVSVFLDSEGLALTGVEVFLTYDPAFFAQVDTLRKPLLFGRVLIDTSRTISAEVSAIHFAEADLAGKAVSGVLFSANFVLLQRPLSRSIGVLVGDATYQSAYTTDSDVGQTFLFEHVPALVFDDLPPVLRLPTLLAMKEDKALVVDLRQWAFDAESGDNLVWEIAASSENLTVEITDSLTAVLTPKPDFSGQLTLELQVTDVIGAQSQGSVIVNVASVNDAPILNVEALPDSIVLTGRNASFGLAGAATDLERDLLTWTAQGTDQVGAEVVNDVVNVFATLDWVGEETIFLFVSDGQAESVSYAIRIIRRQALNTLPGDFDGNGEVGFSDFLAFAQAFGSEDPSSEADLNADGRVDFADFLVFAQNFGRTS